MDIIVTIKDLTNGDLCDFCILEETSNNLYVDVENKTVEITNPTDYQLQIIPDFGSKNTKIQGSHIDKIKVIERQIKAKNKLYIIG